MASYTQITNMLDFQKAFKPAGAFPLDARSMFGTKVAADAAAASAVLAGSADQSKSSYYVGQILTVFENDVVTHYSIEANKTLKEVGKSIATDNKTIVLSGEVLSLKDFGVQYYAYVVDEETHEANHVLTQGWKAGLQPRVIANTDGTGYSLAWYEPSSTTVEGLNDIVSSMQGTVDGLDERIGAAESNITKNTQAIADEKLRAETAESALDTRVTKNTTDIAKLNAGADVEGSIKFQIAEAIANILENPDEAMNSIQEFVDWVDTHAADALELSNNVSANTKAIEEINAILGTSLPEGTQATDVIGYIQEAVAAEKTRAEAAEAALQAKITALEEANTALGTAAKKNVEDFATAAQGTLADNAVRSVVAAENGVVTVNEGGVDKTVTVYTAPVATTNTKGDVQVDGASIEVNEAGVISVAAVDKSKVTGLDTSLENTKTAAVTEANEYTDNNFVANEDVVAASDAAATLEDASDTKVASEKLVMSMLSWQEGM